MEANEMVEFCEQVEKAGEAHMVSVSFSISVLAVIVALVTVLGHRTHTEAILLQAKATDEWGLYQAKKIRQSNVNLNIDSLTILAGSKPDAAKKIEAYKQHTAKWDSDLEASQEKAHGLEERVEQAEHRASRFDIGEALLQVAVVLSSITLLTRRRAYWLLGLGLGVCGALYAATAFFIHP